MAISFLQGTGAQSVGVVASLSKAFNSNIVGGSLLCVAGVTEAPDMPVDAVTDTLGSAYTRHGIIQRASSERVAIFSAIAPTSGANTVTLDATGNAFHSIVIAEVGGNWDADRVHVNFTSATGGSVNVATGNLVTTVATFLFGAMSHGTAGTVTLTETAPWLLVFEDEDTADMPISGIRRVEPTGVTANGQWTTGVSSVWTCGAIAFKEVQGQIGVSGRFPRKDRTYRPRPFAPGFGR